MDFNILDTEATYRRLLAEPDAEVRADIFRRELVEPFRGIVDIFGGMGGDGLAQFAMWGMSPEQFADEKGAHMAGVLDALAQADAWIRAARALDEGYTAFEKYADRISLDRITFGLMAAELPNLPQMRGYTGFGGIPGWIMTVYGVLDEYNLARVEACTVHELHHNILGVAMPKNWMAVTVADYMIMEGLAESFAAELYGEEKTGPWVSEFDEARLDETKRIFKSGLDRAGFDVVRGYIFGGEIAEQMGFETVNVPLYAGYALGYRVVQAYIKRTGKKVVETTFVPAAEIIAESKFFAS